MPTALAASDPAIGPPQRASAATWLGYLAGRGGGRNDEPALAYRLDEIQRQ